MTDFEISLNKMIRETDINRDKAINYYYMFLDFYNQKQRIIGEYILNKEQSELLMLFHQIKGSAINLRLEHFVRIILEMEQDVKDRNFIKCMDTFKVSVNEINKLTIQMNEHKI